MKKNEFIERWGEEKYNKMVERAKENYRRNKERYKRDKVTNAYEGVITNSVTVSLRLPLPEIDDYQSRLDETERMVRRLQHEMRRAWMEETSERFILTVDGGCKSHGKDTFSVRVTLVQIGMKKSMRDRFKKFVNGREWASLIE